jgi:hypothetical protein
MVNSVLMKSGSPKAKPKVNHPKTQVAHCSAQPAELIVTSSTFRTRAHSFLYTVVYNLPETVRHRAAHPDAIKFSWH